MSGTVCHRYGIGDTVWVIGNGRARQGKINWIGITAQAQRLEIEYQVEFEIGSITRPEAECFLTRQELLDSL